jgi:hypothetical protein
MKHRAQRGWTAAHADDLNRGDYRGDFGPEDAGHVDGPGGRRHEDRHRSYYRPVGRLDELEGGRVPSERHGHHSRAQHSNEEWWRRGRMHGGYGSQFDAWSSGAGLAPAGFGFGPHERPDSKRGEDRDWSPTRSARGRGASAGDWAEVAPHHGHGPKNYRRSDESIREDVCERLTADSYVDASEITVTVADGEVTLTGSVPSRDEKRRACDCIEDVSGVTDVFNQLRVSGTGRNHSPHSWAERR